MLTKYFDYIRERFRSAYFSRLESGEWMFAPLGISSMVIRSGFKLPDEAWVETLADRYRLAFKWAIALLPITLLSIVLLPPIFRAFPISENFGFSVTVRVLAFLAVTLSPAIPIAAFYLWAMRRCRHLERVTWSSRLAIEAQVRLTAPWIAWMFFVSQLGATGIFFFLAYSFRDDPFVSIFCAVMGLVMLVLGSLGPVVAKLRRLQAQNEALEALVRERTEELRELNRTLERRVQDQVAQLERMSQLRRFLSPKVADMIVAGQLDDPLATRRREVTIVFVDLRGFTAFSETAEPEDVFGVLREYHAEIGRLVERHEGTIEQFAGDGVMIIFNDPVPLPDAALAAVHFGVELRDSVVRLAESWQKLGHKVGAGIGIAQGYATIGTIGFEGRQDYGVIGAVCNLSARLCAQAAAGQVLVSQRVHARVEEKVVAELVGELALKGIQSPVPAYNVVGMKAAQTATAGS